MTDVDDRVRVSVVGVVVVVMFSVLFARLWYLQVAATGTYAAAAQDNSVRLVPIKALRGSILDREGRPLVINRIARVITVDRNISKEERKLVVPRLAKLLGKTPEQITAKIDDERYSRYAPAPVAIDVPLEAVTYLAEHSEDFPSVRAEALPHREYPEGMVAAHLLGYVGEINSDELELPERKSYKLGDTIGRAGAERAFEAELRGVSGTDRLEVDNAGNVLRSLGSVPPKAGHNVRLTLDLDIQKVAEESLLQGILAARQNFDKEHLKHFLAPAGSVVVLDARDGSVVASASNPTYNPADFVDGIPEAEWKRLNEPLNNFPLTNRVIQGQYAPGSTFKPFTALAAMRDGLVSSGTTITDGGTFRFAGQNFSNAGRAAYGRVNVIKAMTVSSDVYFYMLGSRYWQMSRAGAARKNGIQEQAGQFGFGRSTGIALTSEADGRIPDHAWKIAYNENNPDPRAKRENSVWLPGDNINLAVGQGDLLVTPLQLANAYAAMINGGAVLQPRLADTVTDARGAVIKTFPKVVSSTVPIDPAALQAVTAGLRGVVTDPAGTAWSAFSGFPFSQVPVVAKTGTAEVGPKKQNTSLFAAIATVQGVPYVIASVVEEAGNGSAVAAPITRRVIEALAGLPLTDVLPSPDMTEVE